MSQQQHEEKPGYSYYITGSNRAGRILACKVPFSRGNGVYKQSTKLEDWEVVGNKTLTEEELKQFIAEIRELNMQGLREAVRLRQGEGLKIIELGHGYYQVVKE